VLLVGLLLGPGCASIRKANRTPTPADLAGEQGAVVDTSTLADRASQSSPPYTSPPGSQPDTVSTSQIASTSRVPVDSVKQHGQNKATTSRPKKGMDVVRVRGAALGTYEAAGAQAVVADSTLTRPVDVDRLGGATGVQQPAQAQPAARDTTRTVIAQQDTARHQSPPPATIHVPDTLTPPSQQVIEAHAAGDTAAHRTAVSKDTSGVIARPRATEIADTTALSDTHRADTLRADTAPTDTLRGDRLGAATPPTGAPPASETQESSKIVATGPTIYGPPLPPGYKPPESVTKTLRGLRRSKTKPPEGGAFLGMLTPLPDHVPGALEKPALFPERRVLSLANVRELSTVVDFNPTTGRVTQAPVYSGVPVTLPRVATTDSYAREELTYGLRRTWRDEAHQEVAGIGAFTGTAGRGRNLKLEVPLPGALTGVFGTGANLNVSGSEQVQIGGVSDYVVNPPGQGLRQQSAFPALNMKQNLQVNLGGSIGDKIRVDVDQKSDVQSDLENRIHIDYTGYKDEIIQALNLGNTNLSLPGSQYVSYGGRHEGLFGVRSQMALGGVDVTAIASKEQAKSARSTFTPQRGSGIRIYDDEFIKGRFFFLFDPRDPSENIDIGSIRVWVDDGNNQNNNQGGGTKRGRGYRMLHDDGAPDTSLVGEFQLQLLSNNDYYVDQFYVDPERHAGYPMIVLNTPIRDEAFLAVDYVVIQSDGTRRQIPVPNPETPDSLILKALRVPDSAPWDTKNLNSSVWAPLRLLEVKNVYDLGVSPIDPTQQGFHLRIRRLASSGDDPQTSTAGSPYIQALGLDMVNRQNVPGPDGEVDYRWIDTAHGYLRFPLLEPFADSTRLNGDVDSLFYNRRWFTREINFQPKYYIELEGAGQLTRIDLGRTDIRENSEAVRLDGEQLVRGSDYEIDYTTGVLELKSPRARQNGQLTVDYAYNPLFSLAQNTILGATAHFNLGSGSLGESREINTTWMYEGRGGVSRLEHPRLGESPGRTVVGDITGNFQFHPEIMSRIVDVLPLVRAGSQQSSLTINGEVGASAPNPNTRNVAYIDDMEGTKDITSVYPDFLRWIWSSVPPTLAPVDQAAFRWYNLPPDSSLLAGYVYVDQASLSQTERSNRVNVLNWRIDPHQSAAGRGGRPEGAWAGLTQVISQTDEDLTNAQYLDLFLRVADSLAIPKAALSGAEIGGLTLHVDFGIMGEDAEWQHGVPPNGRLDTENKNGDEQLDRLSEDTGLDTLFDAAEPPDVSGKLYPLGDNYHYDREKSPSDFGAINGTEGNGFLDTEDLFVNGKLDAVERYYEFTIPLADAQYPVNANGFRLYQIPLSAAMAHNSVGATAAWSQIKHCRIWVEGAQAPLTIQLVRLDIVGNRWLERSIADRFTIVEPVWTLEPYVAPETQVHVLVASNKQNSSYIPPPGVEQRDPSVPGAILPEQALLLDFTHLPPQTAVSAFKSGTTEESYVQYDSLELFVRAPTLRASDSLSFFIRFGSDTTNYYEYRQPLVGTDWIPISVPLAELTLAKDDPNSPPGEVLHFGAGGTGNARLRYRLVDGQPRYIAVGEPSLTKVRRVQIGVLNTAVADTLRPEAGVVDSGGVFIDEIRLGGVRKERGVARRVDVSGSFSDLLSFGVNYSLQDANFLQIGQTQGSGQNDKRLHISSRVNLDRFLPNWGVSLPLDVDVTDNSQIPKFAPGSDVRYNSKLSSRGLTGNERRTFGIQYSKTSSHSKLLRYTLDALSGSFSVADEKNRSTTLADSSRTISGTLRYDIRATTTKPGVTPQLLLPPIPIGRLLGVTFSRLKTSTIRYMPVSVSFNARASSYTKVQRDRFTQADSVGKERLAYDKHGDFDMTSTWSPFDDLSNVTIRATTSRDLAPQVGHSVPVLGNTGRELGSTRQISARYDPGYLNFLNASLDFQGYSSFNSNPSNRLENDPDIVYGVSNSQTLNLTGSLPLQKLLGRPNIPQAAPNDSTHRGPRIGPVTQVRLLLSKLVTLNAVSARRSIAKSSTYSRLNGAPGLSYQFGLVRALDPSIERLQGSAFSISDSRNDQLSTTATLLSMVGINSSYTYSLDTRLTEAGGNPQERWTWPDLGTTISNLHQRLHLRRVLASLDAQSDYKKSHATTYAALGSDSTLSSTTESRWQPLLQLRARWTSGLAATLNMDRSSSSTRSTYSVDATDTDRSTMYSLDLRKSFDTTHGLGLPGGKRIKLKNPLTTSLNFALNRMERFSDTRAAHTRSLAQRDWTLASSAEYYVVHDVRSEFGFRMRRSFNDITTLENRHVEVNLTLTYQFQ
jgi:hypothetical protein